MAQGGRGGSAKAFNGGVAIGGPGGHGGDGQGIGGDGGDAEASGVGHLYAGGEGGHVDSSDRWLPPARSGYEIAMEALGHPVDGIMRHYGRGGMSGGYLARYQVVEQLRNEYFDRAQIAPVTIQQDIYAVPVDIINQLLEMRNYNWRVKIVGRGDYEFFVQR